MDMVPGQSDMVPGQSDITKVTGSPSPTKALSALCVRACIRVSARGRNGHGAGPVGRQ